MSDQELGDARQGLKIGSKHFVRLFLSSGCDKKNLVCVNRML
jgi:hypothetical protein